MFKLLVVISLTAFATGSPGARMNGKIVGGANIEITDVPYQVSLHRAGRYFCGASIISKNFVITAAHCATGNSYTIRAGSQYRDRDGTYHNVTQVITHENFGTSASRLMQNDIALMKVDPPFQYDETRRPVPLNQKGKTFSAGLNGLVSGWGRLQEGGLAPPQLQAVKVPLITRESCQKQYDRFGTLPDGQICAAYPQGGKDACQGDSGGPLVVSGLLTGIVSWGMGCARPLNPGVYTEVAHYRDWIRTKTGV